MYFITSTGYLADVSAKGLGSFYNYDWLRAHLSLLLTVTSLERFKQREFYTFFFCHDATMNIYFSKLNYTIHVNFVYAT